MIKIEDLTIKIKNKISDYIEFDINEIFDQSDYITIYGGAVRDSIANLDIHDIDILCMPNSAVKLRNFLYNKYNYKLLDLYDQDALNMYKGITLISEPWTLMNENKRIIQIIRPNFGQDYRNLSSNNPTLMYKSAYEDLLKNVDLSCCGVYIEKQNNKIILKESCCRAISECLTLSFNVNENSKLYNSNRTLFRVNKLESRGWFNFNKYNKSNNILKKEREVKITQLELSCEYDYKIWNDK